VLCLVSHRGDIENAVDSCLGPGGRCLGCNQ
jgi:hypothetical protein